MRCMVVKTEFVVDDGEVGVVRFEEVLQCPRSLFRCSFDIVDVNRLEINCRVVAVREI